MNFFDLASARQSVRLYSSRTVEKEKIIRCVEAAQIAPSACNSQPWKFVIVDHPEVRKKIADETYSNVIPFNKFVKNAPVIVVIVIEKAKLIAQIGGRLKKLEYPLIDIGIAAEHFCLQAEELGLGTCMLGWFNEREIKTLLDIPEKKKIGLLISVGYAVDQYKQRIKIRKKIEEVMSFNKY